jgi:bifunctional DNase/RNase
MTRIGLEIIGMSYSQSQSGAYALILGEIGGSRRLPVIIGGFEAQSIALGLERMQPSRPLTHDLFKNFADHYGINLLEVVINKFKEGVFHAALVCEHEGSISEIDARTSDAIALAIRYRCPVYTYENILDEAGIVIKNEEEQVDDDVASGSTEEDEFSAFLADELEDMLQKSIENEEYEKASRIRDELKKRRKKY